MSPSPLLASSVLMALSRLVVEDGDVADNIESIGLRVMRTAVSSQRVDATDGRGLGGCIRRGVERAARAPFLLAPTTAAAARSAARAELELQLLFRACGD